MNFGTAETAADDPSVQDAPGPEDARSDANMNPEPTPEEMDGEGSFDGDAFGQELKSVYAQSDPEQSAAELRAEFGSDYDNVRQLASGFSQIDGFVEAQHVLEVAGVVNHPAIMRFLMNAGRIHYASATESGDSPGSDRADKDSVGFEDAVEALRARQQDARDTGNSRKANDLYRQELTLIAGKQGGGTIVNGRRTA